MTKLRSDRETIERCRTLRDAVAGDPWAGEALGALLWALGLVELPPYETPFAPDVLDAALDGAALRPADELERERETARLWHWRARTAELAELPEVDLPERFSSLDQAVAAVAVRGNERGLLPAPLRGDFRAHGRIYRHLTPDERLELHWVAAERHHALAWLCGEGSTWEEVPLDT